MVSVISSAAQAQEEIEPEQIEKKLFSRAIEANIAEHNRQIEEAYYYKDMEMIESLFDSIVENVVKGTYLDDFVVFQPRRKEIKLHSFKKPLFLITYSNWYPFSPGEIAALNQMAAKYFREIDFLVLFFDSQQRVQPLTKLFSNRIHFCYAEERSNKFDRLIRSMKHVFGVPTIFYIDEHKKFLDVAKMPPPHYDEDFETSFQENYNFFLHGLGILRGRQDLPNVARESAEKTN